MRRKGRVQAGADADLVVFDEAGVTDQATYDASTRPSSGIAHVLVGGTFVVRDGALLPGRPSRAPGARLPPLTAAGDPSPNELAGTDGTDGTVPS